MKKYLLFILLFLSLLAATNAQGITGPNPVRYSLTDPTGNACDANSPPLVYGTGSTRNIYTCQSGVYAVGTGSGSIPSATATVEGKAVLGAQAPVAFASLGTCAAGNRGQRKQLTDTGKATATCTLTTGSTYAWIPDELNFRARRYGAVEDASTNDATAIAAAITAATAGGVVEFDTIAATQSTITQPNRVTFRGKNVRIAGLKAITPFTGSYVVNAVNGTTSMFDSFIEKMTINANDIAGVGGILSDAYQENSGVRNVLIQKFRTYGILYQNGYGGAATSLIDGAELFASDSGATAGIRVEQISLIGNFVLSIQNSVITGTTVNLPRGIDIVNDSTVITNVHFEVADNGVYLDGVGDHVLIGVTGASTVTTLVRIASTFTGTLKMIGCKRGGATNFVVDERAGGFGTITGEDIADFHIGKTRIDALAASKIVTTDSSRNLSTATTTPTQLNALASLTNGVFPLQSGGVLTNSNLTYSGSTLSHTGTYAGTGTAGVGLKYYRTVANNTSLLEILDSPTAGNSLGAYFGVDVTGGSVGYSTGGVFLTALASGTGTARPIFIHNYSNQAIGFATNNTLRGQFTAGGLFALGNGATSSYPALKRNGTGIDFRLADDSGYAPISTLNLTITDTGTATATAGAATLNTQRGIITSEALTTAAGSTYALTITNSKVTTSSIVTASVQNGTNSVDNYYVQRITPGSGSVVITIYNNSGGALNGTLKISFIVM